MKKNTIIKIILLVASTLSAMCTGVISPAIPLIAKDYHEIENIKMILKMLVVLPNLFIAITSPIAGYAASRVKNKKYILCGGLLMYGAFGTAGFYIQDIKIILLSRVFVGISIAFITTSATAMIVEYFIDPKERSSVISMQTTTMSIGSVLYTMISGIVADVHWRNIFLIYSIALILMPFALLFLTSSNPESKTSEEESDIFQNQFILQNNYLIFAICCINVVIMTMF